MAAPYHLILSKLDRALMAYIIAQEAGTSSDVFPAKRSQGRDLPNTICYSERGDTGEFNYTGNFTCKSSIMVRTSAPDDKGVTAGTTRLASDQRVGKTFDCFFKDVDSAGDKLAEDITTAARDLAAADPDNHADLADFTVQNVMIKGVEAGWDEFDAWVDTLSLEIVCSPSNVS